jgi:hypothetical protein
VNAVRAAANRLVSSKPDLFVREQGRYRYQGPDQQASLNGNGPGLEQTQKSTPPPDLGSEGDQADQQLPVPPRGTGNNDWLALPRTEAVARMLGEMGGHLSPSELSELLESVGRDDPPLAVGKALNHLYRKGRANTVARAKWVLTDPNDPWNTAPTGEESDTAEEVTGDQEMSGVTPTLTGGERWS